MQDRMTRTISRKQAGAYAVKVVSGHYGCDVIGMNFVGGGSFADVFLIRIDQPPYKIIMKAFRTAMMHEIEAANLKLLGQGSPIKLPEVYFLFTATKDMPMDFIAMEWIPGKNALVNVRNWFQSQNKRRRFADQITDALGFWHEQTNDKYGLVQDAVYDRWLDYYKPFAEDILTKAHLMYKKGKLHGKVMASLDAAWDRFDDIFSEAIQKPSLIHGDLNVMNIMTDRKMNITAIIDPLECRWADKEYDLFQLRNLTGDRYFLYETYKAKYPVSEKCDMKCAFYALFNEVYVYMVSGIKFDFILNRLVRWMNRELEKTSIHAS
ncbi:MAG: fructosamine kinase family protein [Candidatus Izemoplasmatales bacterium]|nr:fructosamine kinase family protein [Candidatus Izemoplasmatales bacterium]MDD5292694.1 fructosamine kinase family protein [Candidatus Izemoplasmatales bacterium]